jgi:N-methylhydantoinase A
VNVRLTGVGPLDAPQTAPIAASSGAVTPSGHRPVHFAGAWHETLVIDRSTLGAGDVVRGPAVIEEYGSTLPVPPGVHVAVDRLGSMVVRRAPATPSATDAGGDGLA